MDDLISRSELINKIRGIVPGSQDVDFIVRLIGEQPTAYDVEKVVAETKDVFERLVAEILHKTGSKYTIVDFNLKPFTDRVCDVVRKGGAE